MSDTNKLTDGIDEETVVSGPDEAGTGYTEDAESTGIITEETESVTENTTDNGAEAGSAGTDDSYLESMDKELARDKDFSFSYGDESDVREKASTKTTIVLMATIILLVATILVLGYFLASRVIVDKESGKSLLSTVTEWVSTKLGIKRSESVSDDSVITIVPSLTDTPDSSTDSSADNGTASEEMKTFNVTVTLGQYKGIEIDYPEISVSEEDIDQEIEAFLEDLTEDVPVDRPSQNGDILNISYVGTMDGEEFDGGTDEDVDFELGSGQFFDAFEEGLVGQSVGEVVLDINFPDDYYEELAGKPVTFKVTINSISEVVTPELTDQLIADNTESSTVEEYRAYVRGYLEESARERADSQIENDILQKAVDNAQYGGEIEEEIADLEQRYLDYYDQIAQAYYGVSGADLFCGMYGMEEEEYYEMMRSDSESSVKTQHFLKEVAEAENITYTQEEYQTQFEAVFFDYYGFTEEAEVRAELTDEQIDEIVSDAIKTEKARQLILDSAVINGK